MCIPELVVEVMQSRWFEHFGYFACASREVYVPDHTELSESKLLGIEKSCHKFKLNPARNTHIRVYSVQEIQ